MDWRSWPWKKNSSEKTIAVTDSANQRNRDTSKKAATYVQVSQEKYAHLAVLEDQVKVLNEKLSTALSELTTNEDLVKQHTKVAEEAVSGWEKAEAEASALKSQLESLTLLKLTADERAAHLDAALKECMKEVRNVKEEGEQKLQDVVFAKTRQWEKVKSDLEAKIDAFEQEILQASAENDALTRTLQECSDMLVKINEEKSHAEGEIEVLKANIQSCEREISSLKYEVHIVSKELEIRNEEKNMSMRSADVANKQHIEDVKKIAMLEAECQRLRGLVKKKLPGPATLAQMKLEVDSYGREYGDSCPRRSTAKCSSPRVGLVSDFGMENMQQCRRENELLASRLLAAEEENQMLKEALTKRNSERHASRSIFAKTASRLRSIETQTQGVNQHESSSKYMGSPIGRFLSHNGSYAPSVTSMSEDGVDEEGMFSASSGAAVTPDVSHHRKQKSIEDSRKTPISIQMELMDDFLEMEKLACTPAASNSTASFSVGVADEVKCGGVDDTLFNNINKDIKSLGEQLDSDKTTNLQDSDGKQVAEKMDSDQDGMSISKLQARISSVFDSHGKNGNLVKCCEDVRCILHDMEGELPQITESCVVEEVKMQCNQENSNDERFTKANTVKDLRKAIGTIHDFVVKFNKETRKLQGQLSGNHVLDKNIEAFSMVVNKFLSNELSGYEVILALSCILSETNGLDLVIGCEEREEESITPDCIDKATLLENSVVPQVNDKDGFADSSSNPEIPQEVLSDAGSRVCSMKEFKKLQKEKDNLAMDLARCTENLEQTKSLLLEMEQEIVNLKSNLSNMEKSNCLAETQLKCMAESYRLLEERLKGMEVEINQLRTEAEMVSKELQQERNAHQDDLDKYKDLQEEMERTQKTLLQLEADNNLKANQEREIAAAAEKLGQCQETIFLLGRQLKTLQPQMDSTSPSPSGRHGVSSNFLEDVNNSTLKSPRGRQSSRYPGNSEVDNLATILQRSEGESSRSVFNSQSFPSENEVNPMPLSPVSSKHPKHRSSWSSSSSSISTSDKQSWGFSRFFSKGKSNR